VLIPAVTLALTAIAYYFGFQWRFASTPLMLLIIAAPYVALTPVALVRLHRDGVLGEKLKPRSGDLAFGAVVTVMLYFGALVGRMGVTPHGTAREGWLMRVYLQIGDPESVKNRVVMLSVALALIAILEEIVWRGLVYGEVRAYFLRRQSASADPYAPGQAGMMSHQANEESLGTRRAWPVTALLFAAASLPTLYDLRDPFAGPNPVIPLAALGCGLVWGFIAAQTERLPVAIFSHVFFTLAVGVWFPLWRLV
jgi:hypothetical protein